MKLSFFLDPFTGDNNDSDIRDYDVDILLEELV